MLDSLYHGHLARGKPLFVQKILPKMGYETPYVYVPHALLKDCGPNSLAVGVWIVVGRLNKLHRGSVPLSAADLAALFGYPKGHKAHQPLRASIMRAIDYLHTLGWFCVERATGIKHSLLCTWGDARRPWDFDEPGTGRPAHIRGVQVPIALCDYYVGTITPQSGREAAQIRRYVTRPLLDLRDIGTYALIRHVVIAATPRLLHLGLADEHGVCAPLTLNELQVRLSDGQLTTLDNQGNIVPVGQRDQGWAAPGHFFALRSGSTCGSASGSLETGEEKATLTHGNAQKCCDSVENNSACMDDPGMILQGINNLPTTTNDLMCGGATVLEKETIAQQQQSTNKARIATSEITGVREKNHHVPQLDPLIIANHQALNTGREILAGEWWELVDLATQHSAKQLLIWQARAERSNAVRPNGITPAYYIACAGREAFAAHRPQRAGRIAHHCSKPEIYAKEQEQKTAIQPSSEVTSDKPHNARSKLDQERSQILDDIEAQAGEPIVVRDTLGSVPLSLLKEWRDSAVLKHPVLPVKFDSPLSFVVKSLRRGNKPPSERELERWQAEQPQTPVGDFGAALQSFEEKDRLRREQYAAAFAKVYEEQHTYIPADELYSALMDIAPNEEQWDWLCSATEVTRNATGTALFCLSLESLLVAREVIGVLRDAVADLEWPLPLSIVSLDSQPSCPNWIAPSQWLELDPPLQAALAESVLNDDGSLNVHQSHFETLMSTYRVKMSQLLCI